jgi:antitoxin ParD1/3/4
MNVSLTPELEKFVNKLVTKGRYQTASEVVRDSLRLLEDREKLRQIKLKELRAEIQIGIDQANRGQFAKPEDVTPEAIHARGMKRLAEMRKKAGK